VGGLAAATLFVMYPSSMLSYGQNYKDPFAIAGTLLIVYVFLCSVTVSCSSQPKRIVAMMTAGILLLWSVRPYLLVVVAGALVSAFVVLIAHAGVRY
jgi:hypothetical protein